MALIKRGDTHPPLEIEVLRSNGSPLDLTAAESIHLILKERGVFQGEPTVYIIGPLEIVDAPNGKVKHYWTDAEVADVKNYDVEIEIYWAEGGKQTVPTVGFEELVVAPDLDDAEI
jgi:hypothetical protein